MKRCEIKKFLSLVVKPHEVHLCSKVLGKAWKRHSCPVVFLYERRWLETLSRGTRCGPLCEQRYGAEFEHAGGQRKRHSWVGFGLVGLVHCGPTSYFALPAKHQMVRCETQTRTPPLTGLTSWATQASLLRSFFPREHSRAFFHRHPRDPLIQWTFSTKLRPNTKVFATVNSARTLLWWLGVVDASNPRRSH